MKKIFALVLVLVMMLSLVACGIVSDASKVAAFVEINRDMLQSTMEKAFSASSDMTCTASVRAEGCGITIDICIQEMDHLSDENKAYIQEYYNAMDSQFDSIFESYQKTLPMLDSLTFHICEKDGDEIATVRMD